MKRRRISLSLVVASLLFAVTALAESIRLGGIFDLSSGSGMSWGTAERNGFLLAVEDFNRAHSGISAAGIIEDSQYNNTKVVSAFKKLTSVDRVSIVLGPTWEPYFVIEPLCESNRVLCISISSNLGRFEKDSPDYSLTTWLDEREYVGVIARDMKSRKVSKVGVVTALTPYHETMLDHFSGIFPQRPIFQETVNPDLLDFRSIILRIPSSIEGLLLLLPGENAVPVFLRQWSELKKSKPLIYTDDYILYSSQRAAATALGFEIWYSAPDFNNPRMADFIKRYKAKFNEEPGSPGAAVTYDTTTIVLGCSRGSSETTPEEVAKCVRQTTDYEGFSGIISFEGNRFARRDVMTLLRLEG